MAQGKQVIGAPLVIGGRKLSLSRAIRAGDTVCLTGQIPIQNGMVMTTGSVEDQTRGVLDASTETLAEADFPGFNAVRAEYFPPDPPARSAVVSEHRLMCGSRSWPGARWTRVRRCTPPKR